MVGGIRKGFKSNSNALGAEPVNHFKGFKFIPMDFTYISRDFKGTFNWPPMHFMGFPNGFFFGKEDNPLDTKGCLGVFKGVCSCIVKGIPRDHFKWNLRDFKVIVKDSQPILALILRDLNWFQRISHKFLGILKGSPLGSQCILGALKMGFGEEDNP